MALVPKIDPNKIFASNAPTQDKPAAFDNYEKGMDETRKNLGRPTIPQLNYLHQTADQKILWIHQNGGGLPYDASIEYAEKAVTLKDGELKQLVDGTWVEVKTKSLPATAITTVSGQNQQEINDFGGAKWHAKVGGYELGATVKLENGDIVKSTVPNNITDPNVDMTSWLNLSSATTVATTNDLTASIAYRNGQEVYVQSRTSTKHKGGGRFYFDSSRTAENDGVTVFNGWVRSKSDKLKPEWAGSIGDGVADDSAAFRLIRDVGVAKARAVAPYNANLAVSGYIVSLDPRAKYLVKGANLLGSNEPESPTNPKYSINFELEGNGSCINYEPLSEFDNLFNIDAFIERPIFKNFNLYVKASLPQNSGVIWKVRSGYNGYSGAQRAHISDVRIDSQSGTSNRIRRIFDISGTTQADQILVDQCMFGGFKEFWKSVNPESVNNTVRNCSFNTTTSGGSVYFNISRMGDNFNLVDCNMSIAAGDTVFNFIAPLNGGGTLINSNPAYQFHAIRNRFETYGSGEVIMLNSNHLKLNIEGLTSALASGAGSTKWVWKACEMGSYQFDKCFLSNPQKLLTPILSSLSYGTTVGTGVKLNDTAYQGTLELGAWDGTNEYSVKDALVNKRKARSFRFRDCFQVNRAGAWDFDVVFDEDEISNGIRKQNTVTLNKAGTGFATEFQIPPYQVIDEISVTNSGTLPSTFNGYRVYFGAKSNNNFVDYVDTLSNVVANTEMVIFKGKGIVLNDAINSNVLSVYPLQDSVEVSSKILSSITVKYTALSTYRDGVTSTANATVIKNTLLPKNVGATASRPTKAPYIGWQYFDTTLGKPIFIKTLSPVAWVDSAGVAVT